MRTLQERIDGAQTVADIFGSVVYIYPDQSHTRRFDGVEILATVTPRFRGAAVTPDVQGTHGLGDQNSGRV